MSVMHKLHNSSACRLEHDLSVETFDRIRECAERVRAREEAKKAAETAEAMEAGEQE